MGAAIRLVQQCMNDDNDDDVDDDDDDDDDDVGDRYTEL